MCATGLLDVFPAGLRYSNIQQQKVDQYKTEHPYQNLEKLQFQNIFY